jgi:hypothetical protein
MEAILIAPCELEKLKKKKKKYRWTDDQIA